MVKSQILIKIDNGKEHLLFENIENQKSSAKYKLALSLNRENDSISVSFEGVSSNIKKKDDSMFPFTTAMIESLNVR